MTRRSSHTVRYSDLLTVAIRAEKEAAARLAGAQARGVTNLEALRHDLESASALVRLLKKFDRTTIAQADLFQAYANMR